MRFTVCIPTLNAADQWNEFVKALRFQSMQPQRVIVIDSESTDGTAELARLEGFTVVSIARKEFRHGATRQLAVEMAQDSEILVYLTQDALLANSDALAALLRPFSDASIGAAYGRQLPRKGAGPIEAHARHFNYPASSSVRALDNARTLGFKSIFFSNSFGAYRYSALAAVRGFPSYIDFGEDTVVAARMLLAGWRIAYAGDAEVYHSHNYTFREEFRRYVSVGELHAAQPELLREFGGTSGEGLRFMKSEISVLAKEAPFEIPSSVIRSACKFLGYRLGRSRKKGTEHN
jgi:rhamnosyltransferase